MVLQVATDLASLFLLLAPLVTFLSSATLPLGGFSAHPSLGYVAACPSNLGTGLRASALLPLPRLASDPAALAAAGGRAGLQVRGAGGENSEAGGGGLVDVSPGGRLGATERQIAERLYEGVGALLAEEERA